MLRYSFVMALLMVSATILGGCSKTKSTASTDADETSAEKKENASSMDSVNAVQGEGQGLKSPAKQELGAKFDPAMDPSSVTSSYLKALKESITDAASLKTANELLTAKARSATHLANVDVSLPGSAAADYVVHQAKYVTNEKNVAHVLTSWKDEVEDQVYEYDVTWVLRKEASQGWRVAGMITTGNSINETIVFNFEDAADIVSKGAPEASDTQTANKDGNTEIR